MRNLSAALLARVFSLFATFALSVVVGRALGANEAGVFFYLTTLLYVASTVARYGVDNYLLRLSESREDLAVLRSSVSLVVYFTGTLSVVAALVLANVDIGLDDIGAFERVLFASTLLPFSGLVIIGAYLRVKKLFVRGILVELGLPPAILSISILTIGLFHTLSVENVIALYVLSMWLTFGYAVFSLGYAHSRFRGFAVLKIAVPPKFAAIPVKQLSLIMLTSLVYFAITWAPVLIIGNSGASNSEIGYLYAAIRMSGMVSIIPSIQSSTFGPTIAEKIRHSRIEEANLLAAHNVKHATGASVLLGIVIATTAPMVVPVLYGQTFSAAVPAVVLLSLGAVIIIAFGQVVLLMQITGILKALMVTLSLALAMWLLIGPAVALSFGSTGVAALMVISSSIVSGVLCHRLFKATGIKSFITLKGLGKGS